MSLCIYVTKFNGFFVVFFSPLWFSSQCHLILPLYPSSSSLNISLKFVLQTNICPWPLIFIAMSKVKLLSENP